MGDSRQSNSFCGELHDVRAVSHAKIVLDGLTIVAGPNGSGKTTISRTIQDAIEANLYFRDFMRSHIVDKVYHLIDYRFRICLSSIKIDSSKELYLSRPGTMPNGISYAQAKGHLEGLQAVLHNIFSNQKWINADFTSREFLILAEKLAVDSRSCNYQSLERALLAVVDKAIAEIQETVDIPLSQKTFSERAEINSDYLWDGQLDLFEMGHPIFSYRDNDVLKSEKIMSISRVIYIESPLVSQLKFEDDDLFSIENNLMSLKAKPLTKNGEDAIGKLFHDVLNGEVVPEESETGRSRWAYKRDDGESFDVEDCATGIKGLSILASLYSQGCLNDETLLIMDEPEAHLHPEWIVAYARIIVAIVKKLRLRVMIASHSPDMVNALQAFALSANLSKYTHFYQAQRVDEQEQKFKYEFIDRELSVSDIFKSFNCVYDLIGQYSAWFRTAFAQ